MSTTTRADRERAVGKYRHGQEGVVDRMIDNKVFVDIESTANYGVPCTVECLFSESELEKITVKKAKPKKPEIPATPPGMEWRNVAWSDGKVYVDGVETKHFDAWFLLPKRDPAKTPFRAEPRDPVAPVRLRMHTFSDYLAVDKNICTSCGCHRDDPHHFAPVPDPVAPRRKSKGKKR